MTFSLLFIILSAFFLAKSIFLTVSFLPYFLLHFSFSLHFFLSSSLFYFILLPIYFQLFTSFYVCSSFFILGFYFCSWLITILVFLLFLHSTSFFYNSLLHLLSIILSDQDSFFLHKMTNLNTLAPTPKQISHIFWIHPFSLLCHPILWWFLILFPDFRVGP